MPQAPDPRPTPRTAVRVLSALIGLVAVVAYAALGSAGPASAASPSRPMMFGAAAATRAQVLDHEAVLGSRLHGVRVYRSWDDTLFPAGLRELRDTGHTLFLSVRSQRHDGRPVTYAAILAARPGSELYRQVEAQGRQLRDFRAPVFVAYNHEPDAWQAQVMGTPAQFAAAYRKVVRIWRAQGASNVRTVVTLTAWAYARKDDRRASAYYPGDAYVDDIAADAYNWYDCGRPGGAWHDLAAVIEPQRRFGELHPAKGLMLYEFGSVEDPAQPGRKADWLRDAAALFQQPGYGQYRAALTWEGRNLAGGHACDFDYLSSPSATRAWVQMGHTPAFEAARVG